ncbi:hypothetical protein L1049_007881 [Liquidambar formosana]|uniref:Uncharacterized protein n=1 Tax=Liquidambar formosana TaxID=63359 RepID=A0AAP0S3F5_LIQFO
MLKEGSTVKRPCSGVMICTRKDMEDLDAGFLWLLLDGCCCSYLCLFHCFSFLFLFFFFFFFFFSFKIQREKQVNQVAPAWLVEVLFLVCVHKNKAETTNKHPLCQQQAWILDPQKGDGI